MAPRSGWFLGRRGRRRPGIPLGLADDPAHRATALDRDTAATLVSADSSSASAAVQHGGWLRRTPPRGSAGRGNQSTQICRRHDHRLGPALALLDDPRSVHRAPASSGKLHTEIAAGPMTPSKASISAGRASTRGPSSSFAISGSRLLPRPMNRPSRDASLGTLHERQIDHVACQAERPPAAVRLVLGVQAVAR